MNQKLPTPVKKDRRGGARPGSGRPKGSRDRVTIQGILDALDRQTNGKTYEDLLIEDFVQARLSRDSALIHKYHTLLSSKFVANLTDIQIEQVGDELESKKQAFYEAALALNRINKAKDEDDASN